MSGSLARRAASRAGRDLRRQIARLTHRSVTFGPGCVVRRGLHLTVEDDGRVRFGEGCVLDRNLTVECRGILDVGARTIFGHTCTIGVRHRIVIGEDCLIAELVSIRDHDHRFADLAVPIREQGADVADVVIGRNVWIGSKATVLKGVTIGDDAIVGAGAVVTRDVPAGAIVLGIPATFVRYRDGTGSDPKV
ncbi:MAG TPA: acyltransferase [Dermatophilaceae bacterium]